MTCTEARGRSAGTIPLAGLLLAVLLPGAGRAQSLADYDYENLAFQGVGLEWGRIWPDRVEAAEVFAFRIDLGFLGPAVRIAPVLLFWSSELHHSELVRLAERLRDVGAEVDADDLGPIEWSDLALGLDVQSVWIAPFGLRTYLGLGLGLHALNGQGPAIQDTFVEELLDTVAPSGDVMIGVEFEPLRRFRLFGEARYTLMSDLQYPGVRIGGAVVFPSRVPPGSSGQ